MAPLPFKQGPLPPTPPCGIPGVQVQQLFTRGGAHVHAGGNQLHGPITAHGRLGALLLAGHLSRAGAPGQPLPQSRAVRPLPRRSFMPNNPERLFLLALTKLLFPP